MVIFIYAIRNFLLPIYQILPIIFMLTFKASNLIVFYFLSALILFQASASNLKQQEVHPYGHCSQLKYRDCVNSYQQIKVKQCPGYPVLWTDHCWDLWESYWPTCQRCFCPLLSLPVCNFFDHLLYKTIYGTDGKCDIMAQCIVNGMIESLVEQACTFCEYSLVSGHIPSTLDTKAN